MSNIDWTIHLVGNGIVCQDCGAVENPFPRNICNAHTHGMNRYGHPEFQMILHLHPTTICAILNNLGKRVQAGEKFKGGDYVSEIIMDYKIRLDEFQEDNRKVLRVILPDPQNRFPENEGCEYPYSIQAFTLEALQLIRMKQDSKQMQIRIYQMELNEENVKLKFQDLPVVQNQSGGMVPAEKYRVAFSGKVRASNLEEMTMLVMVLPVTLCRYRMSLRLSAIKGSPGFISAVTWALKRLPLMQNWHRKEQKMEANNLKVERITASSRVRFRCTGCGECCRHVMQIVPLDSQDVFRISKYLQERSSDILCTDDFLSQFGEPAMLDACGYFVYFLKSTGDDDACIFLKGNKCAIQACKPKACRMYPFVIEPNPGGKVPYLLSHEREYHFKGPLISAKAWLKDNLPKEDQEFLQNDYGEAPELVASLKRIPENRRTEALLHFHRLKYSEYDLSQSFLPQYKRNITKLKTILHTMEDTSICDHETMLAD